jgi:hypothetical protein
MGLDWNPIGKPKPGHEAEFEQLFRLLSGKPLPADSLFQRVKQALVKPDTKKAQERFIQIQIEPFETIQAPRVGFDAVADAWARKRYDDNPPAGKTLAQFLESMHGYYVVSLSPPCEGLPVYSNGPAGYVEYFSFRAQWLTVECKDILGNDLLEQCYESCLAPGFASLGRRLRHVATTYSSDNGVAYVEHQRDLEAQEGSPELKAHVLFAATKWCEWWSSRGHGLEAYF